MQRNDRDRRRPAKAAFLSSFLMSKAHSSLDLDEVRLHLLNNGESSGQTAHGHDVEADRYPPKRRVYGRRRISNKLICGGIAVGLLIALVVFMSRTPHVRNAKWPKLPKLKWEDDPAESKEFLSPYQDKSRYIAPVRQPHFRGELPLRMSNC